MLRVLRVPILSDNYVWIVHGEDAREALVIDPGVAAPVLEAAEAEGLAISEIWNTHWHGDHVGGNAEIKAATGARVTGPAREADRIPGIDRTVDEGDRIAFAGETAEVLHVPGHTAGHVAFHFADARTAFVGDTLFAMGCGRLFEGDADEMFANFRRFAAWPDETLLYCAHEYTLANARFALTRERDNDELKARAAEVERLRAAGQATLPTTIALEKATSPFMRSSSAADFAMHRAAKDAF